MIIFPPETHSHSFFDAEHVGKIWKAYAEGGGGGWEKREEDQVVLMWHPSLLSYSNNQTALFLEALSSPLCRWLQEVAKEEEEIVDSAPEGRKDHFALFLFRKRPSNMLTLNGRQTSISASIFFLYVCHSTQAAFLRKQFPAQSFFLAHTSGKGGGVGLRLICTGQARWW